MTDEQDRDDYRAFLRSKLSVKTSGGIIVGEINPSLFEFQKDLVRWGLRLGCTAIFADTGLGKCAIAAEFAKHVVAYTQRPVLVLTPLAVAPQWTLDAIARVGADAVRIRNQHEVDGARIYVCNYDRIHLLDTSAFGGVVLDESSILKDHDSSTRNQLIEAFRLTPYKMACTATPSPNDWTELGNHAEFLGICTMNEMLAEFFINDQKITQGKKWRLKGHAQEAFWSWVASWAAMIKRPSDLGYPDEGYALPPLNLHHHTVKIDSAKIREREISEIDKGKRKNKQVSLFPGAASTLGDKRWSRRESIEARVKLAAEIVAKEPQEPWIVWVALNDEGDEAIAELSKILPYIAQISGSDSPETKERLMLGFCHGDPKDIVTKSKIAGKGMNWQHSARCLFLGVDDSFESFYQALRRLYRFGQKRAVECHIVTSDNEGRVIDNIMKKQAQAEEMSRAMVKYLAGVRDTSRVAMRAGSEYNANVPMTLPEWL